LEVTREHNTLYFHLAGIVPVSGLENRFNNMLPDCLTPIADDYSLIEAAVVECAYAGCDTIWVICNDDISPLVREKLGDFVEDPVYVYRKFDYSPRSSKRFIPIYYVPIHPKDRDKRDCLPWSVIYGSLVAFKTSEFLSTWISPNKYYVSFPYGYFKPSQLREHRKIISSSKNVYISHEGKTMKDNLFTSFTFGKDEFLEFRRVIRTGTGRYFPGKGYGPYEEREFLPIEERWSARFFDNEKVFAPFNLEDANEIKVENYYTISNWEEYTSFFKNCEDLPYRPKSLLPRETARGLANDYSDD